jgi:hypothetical protein
MRLRGLTAAVALVVAAGWLAADSVQASPFHPASVLGQKKKAKKKKGKAQAGKMEKVIQLAPRGLSWGLSNAQVAIVYDKWFDQTYGVKLKHTPLGPQTEDLTAEMDDRKDLIRRTVIAFGERATGVDSTPLKGEYSYRNGESMSKVVQDGGLTRYFFYFNDRLWKVYDEHQLRAGGALGAGYATAVQRLTGEFGVEPTQLEADPDHGRNFGEAQWTDGTNVIRLLNRDSEQIAALVYADASIQAKLPTLRRNRPRREGIDHSVTEATTKAPPPTEGKKKK